MEAFSLLKYWRGGATTPAATPAAFTSAATTIITTVSSPQDTDDENEDNGPFFDLEFSVPVETCSTGSVEFSPASPSEELFFKGDIMPDQTGSDPEPDLNPKTNFTEPFSKLKPATNFRVLMMKLKKNKENEKDGNKTAKPDTGKSNFFIKFKIEEIQIKSVFKRDNSLKSSSGTTNKPEKAQCDETGTKDKRFSKDAMQRYLKMVSKRYGERMRFSSEAQPACAVAERVVGKSRSAAVAAEVGVEGRRDDSLVEQQDGIQSAILHCKRSFNSTRDTQMSTLSRSVSDPSHDHHKYINSSKKSLEELKEKGF